MNRNQLILIFQMGIALLASVALVSAQASCDVDVTDVIEQVGGVCGGLAENQACYGNFEVTAVIQDNAPTQDFNEQGDFADVAFIRSLFLSGLDPDTDRWGIAQMRLVTPTSSGNQDINLLLFGEVQIDNEVEPTEIIEFEVGQFPANIRNSPRDNSIILRSAPSGDILEAVGRLQDSSWVRVRLPDGAIGWVFASLVAPVDESDSIEDLAVQDNSTPYFGPMQAFSFSAGGSSECGNLSTDGMLIQTPAGAARVTLLINEVSIDLLPGPNGATALVNSNPTDGMTLSVVDGTAVVESNNTSFYVNATQQTTIPLGDNQQANGAPSVPVSYNVEEMSGLPVLPIIRSSNLPIEPVSGGSGGTTADTGGGNNGQGNGQANGRRNGQGNGQANGQANGKGNG